MLSDIITTITQQLAVCTFVLESEVKRDERRRTQSTLFIFVLVFCLGTAIHSGLAILSNLENLPCVRWTAVMDDSSRLMFCFIQFFFIFKHSNVRSFVSSFCSSSFSSFLFQLIIRAHESFARLAVMHIVVTNLCVW